MGFGSQFAKKYGTNGLGGSGDQDKELTPEQQRAWARTKAYYWLKLERELYSYSNNGATPETRKLAQESVHNRLAKHLIPFFVGDTSALNLIIGEILSIVERRKFLDSIGFLGN